MKKILTLCLLAVMTAGACLAQRTTVRQDVRNDRTLACGPDKTYSFDVPALTPAPDGYEAVYLSHYGRHGSRYAYSSRTYSFLRDALADGAAKNNLTPYGIWLNETLAPFFEAVSTHVGELTRKGWDQLQGIGRQMIADFPSVFPDGAAVEACVSPSIRSVLSMSACCLAIGQERPALKIVEHQTWDDLRAARPNMGYEPAYKNLRPDNPCTESEKDMILRKVDWRTLLGRMFIHPEDALGRYDPADALDYLYMMVAGMESLDDEMVPDVSGIFTPEEFAEMWEADNYLRYREYYAYLGPCCSIFEDIIEKADRHLSDGARGADLRFGHDHVLLTLLMIADIDEFGHFTDRPDDISLWFRTYQSPMGGNLQFIFYRCDDPSRETLVKVLLNGEETTFSGLKTVSGPYYGWTALKTHLEKRMDLFREK